MDISPISRLDAADHPIDPSSSPYGLRWIIRLIPHAGAAEAAPAPVGRRLFDLTTRDKFAMGHFGQSGLQCFAEFADGRIPMLIIDIAEVPSPMIILHGFFHGSDHGLQTPSDIRILHPRGFPSGDEIGNDQLSSGGSSDCKFMHPIDFQKRVMMIDQQLINPLMGLSGLAPD